MCDRLFQLLGLIRGAITDWHLSLMKILDLHNYPNLASSRSLSVDLICQIRQALKSKCSDFETIAVAGSLGRLEAGPHSDLDCIVITRRDPERSPANAAIERVTEILSHIDLKPAKPWGIYSSATSISTLLDRSALGSLSEQTEIFGKRMQLLLDSKPVYGDQAFVSVQSRIIGWYGTAFFSAANQKSWTYLINDLARYLHAYAAWQQYKFARSSDDSWQLRQCKLRSTRLVTWAGLLFLLGESNARTDKQSWLLDNLRHTPLERLARIMGKYDPECFRRLLAAYEEVHVLLNESHSRSELIVTGPDSDNNCNRPRSAVFTEVHELTAQIIRLLTNFVFDRRKDWDPRFFERLIF